MNDNKQQVCSQAVYDLLASFNSLPTAAEQEEVLDVIYEALYERSYRQALRDRLVVDLERRLREVKESLTPLRKENAELRDRIEMLKAKYADLQTAAFANGKKKLRETRDGLLTIINNIRHYMGDSWETALPWGMEEVDSFIREVDVNYLTRHDTWTRYESASEQGPARSEADLF